MDLTWRAVCLDDQLSIDAIKAAIDDLNNRIVGHLAGQYEASCPVVYLLTVIINRPVLYGTPGPFPTIPGDNPLETTTTETIPYRKYPWR